MKSAISFIKKDPVTTAILAAIFTLAIFFRVWQLPTSFHFLGDQGRDALVVSRIFTDRDLVFIGPVTSVGNMYLGPFYYYFMLPFLFLSYPSPVGPVLAVAFLNIVTLILVYVWGKEMLGNRTAILATGLMAVSDVAIQLSRFSWNPNIVPFFSLLLMYSSYRAWKGQYKWWIIAGIAFSVLLQLHYITILAGAAAGLIWLIQVMRLRKDAASLKKIFISTAVAVLIVVISLTPLMLFDFKHDWSNAKAFQSLLSSDENFVQQSSGLTNVVKVLRETHGRSMHVLFEFNLGKNRTLNSWLVLSVIAILAQSIWQLKNKDKQKQLIGLLTLVLFLVVGILGLSFYEHNVYDHYISFLFPATFLILGYCLHRLMQIKFIGWIPVVAFILFYGQYNISRVSYAAGGPSQAELRNAANEIHKRVKPNEPYSIVLLSESGDLYGMNYQYFLSTEKDKRPLQPEELAQAQKLFIINEDKKTEKPVDLPIYEIVVFDNKIPTDVFTLENGIKVTVLSKEAVSEE